MRWFINHGSTLVLFILISASLPVRGVGEDLPQAGQLVAKESSDECLNHGDSNGKERGKCNGNCDYMEDYWGYSLNS